MVLNMSSWAFYTLKEKEPTTKMGNIISEMSKIQTNNPTTPQTNAHTSLSFKHQYVFKHQTSTHSLHLDLI